MPSAKPPSCPDLDARCAKCGVKFGYITDDDPVALCIGCDEVMHGDCLQQHTCPKRVAVDTKQLHQWEKAARGW